MFLVVMIGFVVIGAEQNNSSISDAESSQEAASSAVEQHQTPTYSYVASDPLAAKIIAVAQDAREITPALGPGEFPPDDYTPAALVLDGHRGIGLSISRYLLSQGINVVFAGESYAELLSVYRMFYEEKQRDWGEYEQVTIKYDNQLSILRAMQFAHSRFGFIQYVIFHLDPPSSLASTNPTDPLDTIIAQLDPAFSSATVLRSLQLGQRLLSYAVDLYRLGGNTATTFMKHDGVFAFITPLSHLQLSDADLPWKELLHVATSSALDTLARVASVISPQLSVYTLHPAIYDIPSNQARAKAEGRLLSDLASTNPLFPGFPGDPAAFANTLHRVITNRTKYAPGSAIVCDHHLTIDSAPYFASLTFRASPDLSKLQSAAHDPTTGLDVTRVDVDPSIPEDLIHT